MTYEQERIGHYLTDPEIFRKIMNVVDRLRGAANYTYTIEYYAPNDVEEPRFEVKIIERNPQKQVVCIYMITGNDHIEDFDSILSQLKENVRVCCKAYNQASCYDKILREEAAERDAIICKHREINEEYTPF